MAKQVPFFLASVLDCWWFGLSTVPMHTWVLDISAVAADGRRPLRVEEKATNSESGNRQP